MLTWTFLILLTNPRTRGFARRLGTDVRQLVEDGWELVTVIPGPEGNNPVAYLKRPKAA